MSATPAVDALLDEKAISHLDFDPTCQMVIQPFVEIGIMRITVGGSWIPCAKPASGVARCRRCGEQTICCTQHAQHVTQAPRIGCLACNQVGTGADVFEFTPFGGA